MPVDGPSFALDRTGHGRVRVRDTRVLHGSRPPNSGDPQEGWVRGTHLPLYPKCRCTRGTTAGHLGSDSCGPGAMPDGLPPVLPDLPAMRALAIISYTLGGLAEVGARCSS